MSEQGKILSWKEWVEKTFTETYANRVLCGFTRDESPSCEYENYKIKKELTTAETAATEYAQQAAELQEEVEVYKKALVLSHRDTVTPQELGLILAALRKARGE